MSDKNITQKEWLSFLDQLHNKLRGAKGIKLTQMPALYEISNFMLFRFLDSEKIVGIKIPKDDRMKKIYEKYATDEKIKEDKKIPLDKYKDKNCYKLWNDVYNVDNNENCLILKYLKNEDLKPYLKSTTNKISAYVGNNKACESIQEIINIIYKKFEDVEFDSKFFDMFGSAYEEFKTNACGNGGKQTAQHFTNVYIKKIIIDELKPKHNEIFYEPCAGSGGFIHTADHYVLEKEGEDKSKIFKKNIFANECNPEIYRPLVLNMLFHNIPITDKDDSNIKEEDSLCNENIMRMKNKCDLVATNFPFGMSTTLEPNKTTEFCWEVLKSGKNYIKNSSGQFVLHIYHSLNKNGRTGFVSDRGILNNGTDNKNSWESKLRKFMFENTNVYKIVLLPQGAFSYTNFQTCIIFFKKGEKTKECNVYDAKFKIEKDKTSEIYVEDKPIKTFKMKDLEKNNYGLGLDDKKLEEIKDGFINMRDIIEIEKKSSHNASEGTENGKYIFLTSSQKVKYSDHNDHKKYKIILGTGGRGSIHYYENFSCSADNFVFDVKSNDYILKYVYYYLYINYSIIENGFEGNGLKHLSKTYVENIQIPSLSLLHQEEIVEFLDKQFELYNIEQLAICVKDIKLFDMLMCKKYDAFADALHIIYRKIEADALHKKFELDKKAIFNMGVNMVESKEYKLGDIVDFNKTGKTISDTERNYDGKDKVPYYGTGGITGYTKDFMFNGEYITFSQDGSVGTINYINGKFWCNHHVRVINTQKSVNIKFLHNYLKFADYAKITKNNSIPNIPWTLLQNFMINVPSIEDQKKIIAEIEKVESEQSSYANYAKILQEQKNNINTIIKNICNTIKKQNEEKVEDNTSDSEEDKKPKKPKKVYKVKKDDSDNEEYKKPKKIHKVIKDDSDSEDDKKPKKIHKVIKDDSDSEDDNKPKKVHKVIKDDSDSEDDNKLKKVIKVKKAIKKIVKKVNSDSDSENDSSDFNDEKTKKKVSKK